MLHEHRPARWGDAFLRRGSPNELLAYILSYDADPHVTNRFVCLSAGDTPTTAPTTQAAITDLTSGGHFSYVYLAGGLTDQCPGRTVLMYEPPGRHGDDVIVLFANGHAEFIRGREGRALIADLQAGRNPPPRR